MSTARFSDLTFKYFDQANKNKNNLKWFEKNKAIYEKNVRAPFGALIEDLHKNLQRDLPKIDVNPKSITRPVRPKNRADAETGLIKNFSHVTLWEKRTSLFEWNPGVHIQFGTKEEDNFVGLGLYMVSSRQLSLLRNALVDDFEEIDALLSDRKLRKCWGEIQGERYKRFPKGFNIDDPRGKYLWHKQFYLGRQFTRTQVKAPGFTKQVAKDLKLAMPFFKWVRQTVGVYRK